MTRARGIVLLCILLILVCSISFYFYKQNLPESEPMQVYKVIKPIPKEAVPTIRENERVPDEVEHNRAEQAASAHEHAEKPPELQQGTLDDAPEPIPDSTPEAVFDTVERQTPEIRSGPDVQADVEKLSKKILDIVAQQHASYPELEKIAAMSKKDFFAAYPTREARDGVVKMAQQAQLEFLGKLRTYTEQMPVEVKEEALAMLREQFRESWGAEHADELVTKVRVALGL